MRALLLIITLASCTAGRAGGAGGDSTDAIELEGARADTIALGEEVLASRTAGPYDSPWDDPEPADLDVLEEYGGSEDGGAGDDDDTIVFEVLGADESASASDSASASADSSESSIGRAGIGAWPPPSAGELSSIARVGLGQARVFLPYRRDIDYTAPDPAYVASIDGLFADAARAEITLLPVLASSSAVPAIDTESLMHWGDFCFWAAHRYGNEGELWHEHEELPYSPARAWEVWSEPNHPAFWPGADVDAGHYRALLLYARLGLRDGDPEARVLVGGLASSSMSGAVPPADFLRAVLDAPDRAQMFDAVAVHPYGERGLDDIASVFAVLAESGLSGTGRANDVPIWVTEIAWAIASPADCTAREGDVCAGHGRFSVVDEAARAERLRAFVEGIDAHPEWRVGAIYWRAWRDLTIEETGGVESWARHTGAFDADGTPRALVDALLGLSSAQFPMTRAAPGRTGYVHTANPDRAARRDEGSERVRRRGRKRAFRRAVIGRMYQLGGCVTRDGAMRRDCNTWTLPAADRFQVDRYPDLERRRAAYVCRALRRLRPTYVSGLVRYGYDEVVSTDPVVRAEIESQARVFDMVKSCVRHGRRDRVRFDVVLNSLHFSHEGFGVRTAGEGAERHRATLERLDGLFRPDVWFYDFYTNPYEPGARTERSCYSMNTRCGVFHPDGMSAGIGWAHRNGQWIGGNTFRGDAIPPGTDVVSLTDAGGMQQVARDRDDARRGHPDLPILMHVRNDPQAGCSEGLTFLYRGEAYRRRVMRRHVRGQAEIGYSYMYPVFFPMRFDREDPVRDTEPCENGLENYGETGRIRGFVSYDAKRRDGTLAWMRWRMDHRRARP